MPTTYESFPLRLLESMACQNAVVASNICGVPEIIRPMDNGILVPPRRVGSLADALIGLLQDRSLRRKLGRNAQQTVLKGFSAEVMMSKTMEIYKSMF
jgi:glycosyltransferase involved in cell wall biosynthesis